MAGGTWTGQNKVQPGVYINTKSKGNLAAQIGLERKGPLQLQKPFHGDLAAKCRQSFPERS